MSRRTLDEVYTTVLMLPLMTMNLRAVMDPEVTITDASPTGGGGAVATMFKVDPDTAVHDGKECHKCRRPIQPEES